MLLEFEATSCDVWYGACYSGPYKRASTTLDLTIRAFRCRSRLAFCLPAVVQLPRVTPEVHPPRPDPTVDLVRQVWGFGDGASQIDEGDCLAVLLPRGLEGYLCCRCTRNRHAPGLRLAP